MLHANACISGAVGAANAPIMCASMAAMCAIAADADACAAVVAAATKVLIGGMLLADR